ncbi:hypothetical protein CO101_00110 [Candidatus Berkelbacteria bacterium CG_4_9_14_3_um_filter_39_23]|uniref:Uncharacterized protein n=2 Tax=Candidatus Berkelbacteria TaxID=1618330 RepID=A0A2M7CHH0_9BACT|nr:hypothetical protein [Candidatus Berkelbacteria bacterium]OIP05728.1 MAG: hypothetical protein AUK14_01230 [Candidatus Berkelbacteria bacterium CG2_30_39_44]PIR28147.1 MAG: hypothetical protein COV39_00675 [Candidatus Berkelbacteria bacterium CG11_big_fil_rev_8_21_14_0_20_40_23]PIV25058.1 MAG: hypothetical protein COS38_03700 [Candidatus Berkelbacteria bacterium CG03_land_8_20_14_0_80_40_36]PIX30630.1 MAG: hypothetical protein COZ62_01630 [Candidatus Berkelbacteria bacterium CG_4_8_14_3_um_f
MKKLVNFSVAILMVLATNILTSAKTLAICPVCTVAVGAGIELSRWLGVDDTITGLWVGAFVVSVSWWTIGWLKKKKAKIPGKIIWVPAIYLLTIYYILLTQHFLFIPSNMLWGIDKLILGASIGALVFFWTATLYLTMKKKNNNKPHFPYEKIAMIVGGLIILSVIFYLITK